MLLVADVGNTETTLGLAEGDRIVAHWRVTTEASRTPDEVHLLLHNLLAASGRGGVTLRGAAIGSVVPGVTMALAEAASRMSATPAVIVDAKSKLGITLDVDEPMTVGADRIINTLAASRLYRSDCIVVDLGTATTYDCITKDGVFLGGVIQPGVKTSAETLFRRTAKLAATELQAPAKVIGTRTEECIRAGVVFGAADSVTGIVNRIIAAWPNGGRPKVVATGGLAVVIQPHAPIIELVDPDLTLQGLRMAHEILTQAR